MTFSEYSVKIRDLIEDNLRSYLSLKRKEEDSVVFKDQEIVSVLEEFVLRGKLLRGTLFLFSCEMLGVKLNKELTGIACGIELMHSSLLIHDDIIDKDYTRRGQKTVFAKYIDRGKTIKAYDPLHYGISLGIVSGITASLLAFELFSKYTSAKLSKLLQFFSNEIYLVSLAEGADSEFGQSNIDATEEEIYSIYRYKTARYTFSLPFVMGCIVADADKKTTEILESMGEMAGIIFQMKDDELGLFGDEKTIGKPVGGDIRENKKTILRALLYKRANAHEKENLNKIFGNEQVLQSDIETIKEMVNKYKILDEINDDINNLMGKIRNLIEKLTLNNEHKNMLKELFEFNLKRTY